MSNARATFARHPIHPMLIPFPIALFTFSLVCDLIFRGGGTPLWHDMAFYTMLGGVIGALAAAVPGFVDYVGVLATRGSHPAEDSRVSTIATSHMALNLTIVVLYVVNLYLRSRGAADAAAPFWLSIVAVLLLVASGWLGGSLVYVHGVAVSDARDASMPHPTFIEHPLEPAPKAPSAEQPPHRAAN